MSEEIFDAIAAGPEPDGSEVLASLALTSTQGDTPTPSVPAPVLSIAPPLGLGQAANPPWKLFDLHVDHLGSTRLVTDDSGAVTSRHDYMPFGLEISQGITYNTHAFTGHERDKATGLDYMLARYYGGSLPRFLSPDPITGAPSDPQALNRYAYARGNPLPLGAVFSHTFGPDPSANTNQIQTEGYRFDKNGNMTRFRHIDGPVAALWTAQNRMAAFYTGDPETTVSSPTERYTYDASGYRVLRFPESGNGLRVVTLRDGTGQPLAEYVDSPGSAHPRHAKDFVHGAGMLLMERWIDGSAPSATNTSPMASNGNVGLSVSAADPIETWAVDIRPEGGGASFVSGLDVDSEGKIWLPESSLAADVTNYLRVRRDDGEAGAYSNAVTVAYDPDVNAQSANQVRAVSVSRSGTNVQVRWQLFQANGKALRLYYQRADGGGTLLLTPAGLASGTTTFSIQNQSLTVQCGYFYLTQQISGSNWSGPSPAAGLPPSGSSQNLSKNGTGDCSGGAPGPEPSAPAWVDTFHHRDHLGSLRIVTDAGGWVVPGGRHDYYPFGMEMVPTNTFTGGGSRKRFTGHERDEESGLDYMLGRYQSASIGSFVSTDPSASSMRVRVPQSWNRFAYVVNDPLLLSDPTGLDPYLCGRPLNPDTRAPSERYQHMFIVYDADRLGDPAATVRSWGDDGNDRMGEVTNSTTGPSSETHSTDVLAWKSLSLIQDPDPNVACVRISKLPSVISREVSGPLPSRGKPDRSPIRRSPRPAPR